MFGFIFNIFYIISGIIGIVAIGIVFWDHFIDDRLLSKRIQFFYETIENLIFTYYKHKIWEQKTNTEFEIIERDKKISYYRIENDVNLNIIWQNKEDCAKYIGLFLNKVESMYHTTFYIDDEKYILEINGALRKSVYEPGIHNPILAFCETGANKYIISDIEIAIINQFLANLRNYWKGNFSKRKMFRGNLSRKLDFRKLID